jgi:hypothetical protein
LICAGNAVHGDGFPSFGEALLFFARPFDPWLGRRRVLLTFLLPLSRWCRISHVLFLAVGMFFFFFVDVLGAISELPVLIVVLI